VNRLRLWSKKAGIALSLAILILGFIIFCFYQNNSIVISEADYNNPRIPGDFDGFRIVHISDLHNKMFGDDQNELLDKVKGFSPDIIVVTGDLIDRRKYDLETAMAFISGAVKIAPVYYVSGNHEAWSGKFPVIKERLIDARASILDDTAVELSKGKSSLRLLGLSDPGFLTSEYSEDTNIRKMKEQLKQWSTEGNFAILLSHRPELFDLYCENNIDLVFAGHAHGGQIRIPFIGGLVAPNQGLFPKYTSGSYSKDSTTMFVSRGLGNSIFPVRIFNRPEIVAVTLRNNK
jgi:predicted MPP superfamily phosphohydrolase